MRFPTVWLLLSAAIAIFAAGCTSVTPGTSLNGAELTVSHYAYSNPTDPANSFICREVNSSTPCGCMFCQNHTSNSIFARLPLVSLLFGPSLKQGNCSFVACNLTIYNDTLSNPQNSVFPRAVMLGSGPSFASTALATRYCNYSMQLSVKWLIGTGGAAPKAPVSSRAECWLDRDIIPLYIYYTNGTPVYNTPYQGATAIIAQQLAKDASGNQVGPVLLTTELSFDGTDPNAIAAVENQIGAIRSACPKCLLVLALNSTDNDRRMAALKSIFGPPNAIDHTYYDKVDVVGFGFRANDYPTCTPADVIGSNYIFSRDVMRQYSKPTMWLYAGASEGNNSDGTCSWDAPSVNTFYENIFSLQQGMASSGIIGSSFYELIDRSGPLPCQAGEGCSFGFLYQNGTEKHPEINAWSYLCGVFGTKLDFRPPLIFSSNTFGEACDVQKTDQILDYIPSDFNTNQGLSTDEVVPTPAKKGLSCGESCPSPTLASMPGGYSSGGSFPDSGNCGKYPLIDQYADDRDVSSTFFKAIVQMESGFDPNVVSCISETSTACNQNGLTIPQLCALLPGNCDAHVLGGGTTCPAGMKPCAYGLAQCIDYPGAPAQAACGGSSYNPFDPTESICCGVNKLQAYLGNASAFVTNNWGQLSACGNGLKDRDWTAYFIAAGLYHGDDARNQLQAFISNRDKDGSCKGEQNFITYLIGTGKFNYAAQVMGNYKSAADACGSECSS